jgi:hypothetical protein
MADSITIAPMDASLLVWRCLHGGPLDGEVLATLPANDRAPWPRYRARNLAILDRCTRLYGACAMLARDRGQVIGVLRFYPTELICLPQAGGLCLQQDFPAGPSDDFAALDWPAREALASQTLRVHCLTVGRPGASDDPYRRRGIGSALVEALVAWAQESGFRRVEAFACPDLPIFWDVAGQAALPFWQRLGFRAERSEPGMSLDEDPWGLVPTILAQAAERGLARDEACRMTLVAREW